MRDDIATASLSATGGDDHKAIDRQFAIDALVTVQNRVSAGDRDLIAEKLALHANEAFANPFRGERHPALLSTLRDVGIVRSPISVPAAACQEVVDHFTRTPCYNAHVPAYSDGAARLPAETRAQSHYGSYKLEQCLRAPHLLEFALRDDILDIAGGYLGCLPTLYSMNTFWTFPSATTGLTHNYHRDEDDYRFLAVFVYWTDVAEGEGEFYFVPRTHSYQQMNRFIKKMRRRWFGPRQALQGIRNFDDFRRMNGGNGYANASLYEKLFPERQMIVGPPGTTFIADTFGIHRGSLPKTRPRLTTWFRFGLYANEAYKIDKTRPVHPSVVAGRIDLGKRNGFICRLVLNEAA
jgi:hypothetical protein